MDKEQFLKEILTRREAEQLIEMTAAAFQHHLKKGNIKPCKESGHGTGAVQLFWRQDVLALRKYKTDETRHVLTLTGSELPIQEAVKYLVMVIPSASHHEIIESKHTNKESYFKVAIKDWSGSTIEKATIKSTENNKSTTVDIEWNKEVKNIKDMFVDELLKVAKKEQLDKDLPISKAIDAFEDEGIDFGYWENDFITIEQKFWNK